jgi:hypothetical protein
MKASMAKKNYITDKVKRMRDNEDTRLENVSFRNDKSLTNGELSTVIYAIIRKLNYLYDTARDEDRKQAILEKKAYLMIKLLFLEEK